MGESINNSARSRINSLLDTGSFIEFGALVKARNTDFNMQMKKCETDGVVTGYGLVNGNPVYIYAQAREVMGGTIGEMHSNKICELYDKAMLQGFPIIALIDCGGIRIEEGIDALNSFAEIYHKQVAASGVVPQITGVFGETGGGAALLAKLSDVVYMEKDARLFINSPNALLDNHLDKLDTSGADFQSKTCGNVDGVFAENELLENIKRLVNILPLNFEDKNIKKPADNANRLLNAGIDNIDEFVRDIADDLNVIELKKDFAPDIMTALIRLNGQTVGVVANRKDEVSSNALIKASEFVKFCDCFNISLVNFTNATGFLRTVDDESTLTRSIAGYAASYSMATVPKINVITKKAYGTAFSIFGSKALGCDMVFCYNTSSVGVMDSGIAAGLIYENESKEIIDEAANIYENTHQGATAAANRGIVDTIIEPDLTRRYLIATIEMLLTKREFSPVKKHLSI